MQPVPRLGRFFTSRSTENAYEGTNDDRLVPGGPSPAFGFQQPATRCGSLGLAVATRAIGFSRPRMRHTVSDPRSLMRQTTITTHLGLERSMRSVFENRKHRNETS
jgi:hypothetical protein